RVSCELRHPSRAGDTRLRGYIIRNMRGLLLFLPVAVFPLTAQSNGADVFESKIRPVLVAKCYACHSSKLKSPMSGLVLDTKAGLQKGGASGPGVIAGK